MSLSDYISIFDTRRIAQSHLFEAATATLYAIYTGYMSIYTTRTNAYALQIAAKHEQRVYAAPRRAASSCTARHGRHATPGHATPRHAMPLRKAHLTLPAGPADADADSDAATAAARCLYRECTHVRVRTHRREVGYKTLSVRYSIYLCRLARLMDETPVECLKLHRSLFIIIKKKKAY